MPLQFTIITPMRTALDCEVLALQLPASEGELEILPDHVDLISSVENGELRYRPVVGEAKSLFIGGGFLQVEHNKILIVTDIAVEAGDIDKDSVEKAIERAQIALKNRDSVLTREEQTYLEGKIAQQLAMLDFRKNKR